MSSQPPRRPPADARAIIGVALLAALLAGCGLVMLVRGVGDERWAVPMVGVGLTVLGAALVAWRMR
jgi:hypothetical protein